MVAPITGRFDAERAAKFSDKPKWEEITYSTHRLDVPGGWIYRMGNAETPSLVFVPMPKARKA